MTEAVLSLEDEGFCPNCGKTAFLHEYTGWCDTCTNKYAPDVGRSCSSCGALLEGTGSVLCNRCKYIKFNKDNAEHIQHYVDQGMSFRDARIQVYTDSRPRCIVCGNPIRGGKKGVTYFCKVMAECRRQKRRYRLLKSKGLSPTEALEQIKKELIK